MRVALLVTCLADTFAPAAGRATVAVLERVGCRVEFPLEQTCCGQMHANTGYPREAADLARRLLGVFAGYDAVVSPPASFVRPVREQYRELAALAADEALARDAAALAPRVHELSEFLTGVLGIDDVGATFRGRVTYHPTCHSLRILRVGDGPERLLRAVRGLDYLPLPDAEECCGFGGTFSVKNPAVSGAILADTLARIRRTGADHVCALDASCLLHLGGGLERAGHGPRPIHLAEILASTA